MSPCGSILAEVSLGSWLRLWTFNGPVWIIEISPCSVRCGRHGWIPSFAFFREVESSTRLALINYFDDPSSCCDFSH